MPGILYGTIIVCALLMIVLGVRLRMYKGQIRHIKEELSMLRKEDTNYRLSSYCRIGETEEIIQLLNEILEKDREEVRSLKRENRLYKESITSISHDIRTPLTSAKGYTQMIAEHMLAESTGSVQAAGISSEQINEESAGIEEKSFREKQQEYIRKVEQRIDDVTDMLNQLFEYARVEAGELEFQPERINLNNLFTETVSMFYDDLVAKKCEPVVEIAETPCYIYADKRAMTRIIENLVKNALVHGTGDYIFSIKKQESSVVLVVSNKTDSIEEKDIDRIFDRFYTTDQSRTRKTTGLGLAIVKRFASQMGGTARAFLKEDVFTVEIEFELREEGGI